MSMPKSREISRAFNYDVAIILVSTGKGNIYVYVSEPESQYKN